MLDEFLKQVIQHTESAKQEIYTHIDEQKYSVYQLFENFHSQVEEFVKAAQDQMDLLERTCSSEPQFSKENANEPFLHQMFQIKQEKERIHKMEQLYAKIQQDFK